jgi:putative redox protein
MKAMIRYVNGRAFVAKSDSNHWVPLDLSPVSGGTGAANDPFQLFALACGGCASIDVVDILAKSRKTLTKLELDLEITRADSVPKIARVLHYHFNVDGPDLTFELVGRAIELSLTKYCSVTLSLDRSAVFRAQITLNGETGTPWKIERNAAIYEQ